MKGLFSMDVHRLFRSFIPGLISLLAFLPFYWIRVGKFTMDFIKGAEVFIYLIIAYMLGVLIEWISDSLFHYFCDDERDNRVKEICEIFNEDKSRLCSGIEDEYAALLDYYLHESEKMNLQRERIYFMFSRMHSIEASTIGIIVSTIMGFLFWIYNSICANMWSWVIFTIILLGYPFIV
jgi:hypothetical protein